MNQILQSDWFRERAEFSDLDRGQRNALSNAIERAIEFGKIKGFLLVKSVFCCSGVTNGFVSWFILRALAKRCFPKTTRHV